MKRMLLRVMSLMLTAVMLFGLGNWSFAVDLQTTEDETEIPEGYTPIYTPEDFDKVRENLAGNYILMNDIEITILWPLNETFTGVFDGNGCTLSYSTDWGLGLFGRVSGTIKNLNVYGVVEGCSSSIGGIADYLDNGVIENCQFDGQMFVTVHENSSGEEPFAVGGIAGYVYGRSTIRNCANYGDVAVSCSEYRNSSSECTAYVGGIAGRSEVTLECCANYGNIILTADCPAAMGGVLGYSWYGAKSCFNAGSLYVGQTEEAEGKTVIVGGVVGEVVRAGEITNTYNIGYWDINSPADMCLGGIAGVLENTSVTGAYNVGTVFHDSGAAIGGIAGKLDEESILQDIYFPDTYSSARADMESTDGQYTLEDLQWSFLNLSYNQEYNYDNGEWYYPWSYSEDSIYPYPQLNSNPYRAFRFGSGTEEDPYQVRNMQELNAVRYQLSAHYIMTQDIICTTGNTTHPAIITGYSPKWYPIGSYRGQRFEGTFDGAGHTIANIYAVWTEEDYAYDRIDNSSYFRSYDCYMGLFGYNCGLIQNLTVSNNIESQGILDESYPGMPYYKTTTYIGGIAGCNVGTIRHCVNQSYITGLEVGGIAAYNYGIIEQCANEDNIFGYLAAGGIASYNSGTIRECANTSYWIAKRGPYCYNYTALQSAGGISATNANNGHVENCYNTAQVLCDTLGVAVQNAAGIANGGTIENCYNIGQVNLPRYGTFGSGAPIGGKTMTNVYAWNIDGKGTSSCFRTSEELKQQETYAGFDFENVWTMPDAADKYPFPVLRSAEVSFSRLPVGMVVTKAPSRHVFLKDEELRSAITDGEFVMCYNDGTTEEKVFIVSVVAPTGSTYATYIRTLGTVGKHFIQVWPNEFTPLYYYDTFEAVDEKLPLGIEITQKPDKTEYYVGESLDITGLEVTVSYNTEHHEAVEDYTLSDFDPDQLGTQTITVTYGEFTDAFDVEVVVRPACAEHTFGEWIQTVAPTCTDEGVERRDCTVCDHYETRAVSATGHTASAAVVENMVEATCTEGGSYDEVVYCSVCGEEMSREVKITDALGHKFSGWNVIVAPTCTETGIEVRYCKNCDHFEKRTIEMTAHDYAAEWTVDTEPTCTVAGSKSHHCKVCDGKTDITEIPATGHSFGEWIQTDAPSCTDDGIERRDCTACDHYETKVISASGHTASPVVIENAVEVTCTENGSYDEVVYCSVCGAEISREGKTTEAVGHKYGEWSVIVEPTCTATGIEIRCCENCDAFEKHTVEMTAHDYLAEWTVDAEPTCTEAGSKSHHCKVCDGKTDITEIPANGHTFGEWILTDDPTCMDEGTERCNCTACDHYETRAVSATGHTASGVFFENALKTTCTAGGSYDEVIYCTVCGTEMSREHKTTEAIGHKWMVSEVVEATPTERGYTVYVCENDAEHTYIGDYTDYPVVYGDLDGNGYLDTKDVTYLINHIEDPEKYPISDELYNGGDFNMDGTVDRDDAVYLLYSILMPDRYPLKPSDK